MGSDAGEDGRRAVRPGPNQRTGATDRGVGDCASCPVEGEFHVVGLMRTITADRWISPAIHFSIRRMILNFRLCSAARGGRRTANRQPE